MIVDDILVITVHFRLYGRIRCGTGWAKNFSPLQLYSPDIHPYNRHYYSSLHSPLILKILPDRRDLLTGVGIIPICSPLHGIVGNILADAV